MDYLLAERKVFEIGSGHPFITQLFASFQTEVLVVLPCDGSDCLCSSTRSLCWSSSRAAICSTTAWFGADHS